MKRRRVKITGLGFVTPAGVGKDDFRRGILERVSRVGLMRRIKPDTECFVGAEVKNFRLAEHVSRPLPNKIPRHTQFAIAGAALAIRDAGLAAEELRNHDPLIVTGTSLMDGESVTRSITAVATKGPRHGLVRTVQHGPVGGIPNEVARTLGIGGRTLAISTSCCAGADAIGVALGYVASGEAEIAICGGAEAPLNLHPLVEMKLAGLMPGNPEHPERQCRPFDLWRTTGVIGEGATMLVLEPEESPRPGYAWLSGYGFALDPEAERPSSGLFEAGKSALANAALSAAEVDAVSLWGPGHRVIDAEESEAMRRLFGDRLEEVTASSIKGAIGNPLAASGAIQVGCAALGMCEGFVPPAVNWEFPDPACPVNLSASPRSLASLHVLVNAHGMSGTNACMVLSRCESIR